MMTLLVSLILPLLALWLWLPVNALSRRQRRWRISLTMGLAFVGLGFATLWRLDWLEYEVVAWVQLVFGWVLVMFVLLLAFLLLRTLGWLASRLLARTSTLATVWHGARLNDVAAVAIVLLASWGIVNGLRPPKVQERDLVVPNLPAELDGVRVAVLADLHLSLIHI